MRDDLDLSPEFLSRIRARRLEWNRLVMRFMDFPRLQSPAQERLRRLIKRRTEQGIWPPRGDEVDTDQELAAVLRDAEKEQMSHAINGPLFKAVAGRQRAREYTAGVLARCQRQRDRDLAVRKRLLRDRAVKRGIL
jgi:hypothetical protein